MSPRVIGYMPYDERKHLLKEIYKMIGNKSISCGDAPEYI